MRRSKARSLRSHRDARFAASRLALVRERLGFLERDLGFAAPTAIGGEASLCIAFEGRGMNLSFASDRSEPPVVFVTIREPHASFTLAEAIDLVDPGHSATMPRTPASAISDEDFASWVDYHAEFLARHARVVLLGAAELAARVAERRARE